MLLVLALFSPRDARPKSVAWLEAIDTALGRTATTLVVVVVSGMGNGAIDPRRPISAGKVGIRQQLPHKDDIVGNIVHEHGTPPLALLWCTAARHGYVHY